MVSTSNYYYDDLYMESILKQILLSWHHMNTLNVILGFLMIIVIFFLLVLWMKNRQTKRLLQQRGLPTVQWRPRFLNYSSIQESDHKNYDPSAFTDFPRQQYQRQKLASSTITNILPRMERLNGPFGMYGTVYGISTAVVHVAHPIPARAIFYDMASSQQPSKSSKSQERRNSRQIKRRSSSSLLISSTGASKAPAYDHFKNFCGHGVFTADGSDWKAKRTSLMHCLIRGATAKVTTSSSSNENSGKSHPSDTNAYRLLKEANRAADTVRNQLDVMKYMKKQSNHQSNRTCAFRNESDRDTCANEGDAKPPSTFIVKANIVPLFQRATVGLIYRYLTHHEPEWGTISAAEKADTNILPAAKMSPNDPEHCSIPNSTTEQLQSSDGEGSSASISSEETPTVSFDHTNASILTSSGSTPTLLNQYLNSIINIRMIILAQSRSLWFLLPRWVYRTFSSMYREEEETVIPIRQFAREACRNAQPDSPLALLRQSSSYCDKRQPSQTRGQSENDTLSKDLLDEAITLLFAGQDTSAATLSWTLHLLSLHPAIQSKLAEEVEFVLGGEEKQEQESSSSSSSTLREDDSNIFMTKATIAKMPYLDAVIKESMRLYPVAPFVARRLMNDVVVSSDEEIDENNKEYDQEGMGPAKTSVNLPKGSIACIWIYGLHRNPKLWNNPSEFIPERWMDPTLKDKGQTNGSYMPFAAGPRNCLGQPLAHIIVRILLAQFVYRYEIRDAQEVEARGLKYTAINKDDITAKRRKQFLKDMQAGFTVLPSGGVTLAIHERKRGNL